MIHNTQYAAGGGELATVTFQFVRISIFDYQGNRYGLRGSFQVPVNTVVVLSGIRWSDFSTLVVNGMAERLSSGNSNLQVFLVTGDCSFSE